ncbi:MAG: hypothetical protein FJX74_17515 [Armatimonadetes bacterium]|nr:hypothetical protein [Armatimonadota bacterium]
MPVVNAYPEPEQARRMGVPLFVDSDADTNAQAIREVDLWCRERGLVRARESHLSTVSTPEGALLRRAICYRPSEAQISGAQQNWADMERRLRSMPETAPLTDSPLED